MARGEKGGNRSGQSNHALQLTRWDFPGGFQTTFAPTPAILPRLAPVDRCVIFQFGFGA